MFELKLVVSTLFGFKNLVAILARHFVSLANAEFGNFPPYFFLLNLQSIYFRRENFRIITSPSLILSTDQGPKLLHSPGTLQGSTEKNCPSPI